MATISPPAYGQMHVSDHPSYRLFTPRAVMLATFLGSPLAGSILMALNYRRNGEKKSAWTTFFLGLLGTAALFALAFILMDHNIDMGIATGSMCAMYYIAKSLQKQMLENHAYIGGKTDSLWKAAGVGLSLLVLIFAIIFAGVMLFDNNETGQRLSISPTEDIYYSGQATQQQAKDLGKALQKIHYFNGSRQSDVLLSTDSHRTIISFVVGKNAWEKPEVIESLRQMGGKLGITSRPLVIRLIDSELKIHKEISID